MDPTATAPAAVGHTKQYVFVDEYNRHKRLKVMRACDGCRKRKQAKGVRSEYHVR